MELMKSLSHPGRVLKLKLMTQTSFYLKWLIYFALSFSPILSHGLDLRPLPKPLPVSEPSKQALEDLRRKVKNLIALLEATEVPDEALTKEEIIELLEERPTIEPDGRHMKINLINETMNIHQIAMYCKDGQEFCGEILKKDLIELTEELLRYERALTRTLIQAFILSILGPEFRKVEDIDKGSDRISSDDNWCLKVDDPQFKEPKDFQVCFKIEGTSLGFLPTLLDNLSGYLSETADGADGKETRKFVVDVLNGRRRILDNIQVQIIRTTE